jgi:cysteine desulfurase/selenocysteine lyase
MKFSGVSMDEKQLLKIREDFPLLSSSQKNPPIYFDNACQTLRPKQVIEAVERYYREYPACGGRSSHKLAELVTEKYEEARKAVAELIGARKKEEVIFTRNTTEGINLIAKSLDFKEGDIVLTSDKEHNSNLIPWQLLGRRKRVVHQIIPSKEDNTFDLEGFKEKLEELGGKVKLVAVCFTSNLDGVTAPAKEIITLAHRYGALVLLDAAQTAPHQKINVAELDVDFLAFSGHKMLGPSGTGVLYGKYQLLEKLEPFLTGGETVANSTYKGHELLPPPQKFEAGLQNYAGVIGLGEAVNYLRKIGFDKIKEQEFCLNKFLTEELSKIPQLKIIGPQDAGLRGGIISFYIEDIGVHRIALLLSETGGIMVRAGQHCVHSWFNARNLKGSLRVSLYFYNTLKECETFIKTLKNILSVLK